MGIEIKIAGETAQEVKEHLAGLVGVLPAGEKWPAQTPKPAAPDVSSPVEPQPEAPAEDKPKRTRKAKAEKPDPEPETGTDMPDIPDDLKRVTTDNEEDAEQDAEDEEAEAESVGDTTLTLDDVRGALRKYVDKFGIDAAQEDGPKLLRLVVRGAKKISDLPDDQKVLGDIIKVVEQAAALDKRPAFKE